MTQKSLVLMKPDALKRGIVGEILHRFERAGLKMVAVKMINADLESAEKHYPNSEEWKRNVGRRTVEDCEKYGIDPMKSFGTADTLKIGEMVKQWNVEYLTSGPILALVLQGLNAVERVRSLVGDTVPVRASAGTVRGDFSLDSAISANQRKRSILNLIHASGAVDEAETEIALWFKPEEILSYKRVHEDLYN